MRARNGWSILLFVVLSSRGGGVAFAQAADDLDVRARAIHLAVVTMDTHIDIPPDYATEAVDPGKRGAAQVDLPKMEEGGLDVGFFAVYVGQTERTAENEERARLEALAKFAAIHRMTEELYPERIGLAKTAADVKDVAGEGRLVALIGIENGYAIGKDITLLSTYYDLGARYMTLTHSGHNDIADSATPQADLGDAPSEHGGLSAFGREVVLEMNRLGMMVDVSHTSRETMLQAARLSKAPVIASHSSVKALCDHARNLDDEQLLALKENGGVIQVVAFASYVKQDPPEKRAVLDSLRSALGWGQGRPSRGSLSEEQRAAYRAYREQLNRRWPRATVDDLVNHIDYAVKLIGIDHVGISSDFDGGGGVDGWNDAGETLNVTRELVERGYTPEEIEKLWSGNLLRVLRENERVARELQGR